MSASRLTPVPLVTVTNAEPVLAFANWGAWVGRCPSPWCTSAKVLDDDDRVFRCDECPTVADVAWPEDKAAIQALLMMRPDPKTRNFLPYETTTDLMFQNVAHGIDMSTNHLDGSARGQLLFDPETLGVTLLPEPIAIDQAVRPEIGS